MKTLLIILFLFMTIFAVGQGKAEKEFIEFFKKQKLEKFLLVKSGCGSCEISYEYSLKTVDTLTIFLLYKRYGQISLINFSDTGKTQKIDNIQTEIFKLITNKKHVLKQADGYYIEQKLLKFQAPCLATFPYEKIQVQVGQFQHKHTLVDREMDDCGTNLKNEEWFNTELEILAEFDRIKTQTDKKQRETVHLQ